MTIPKDEDIIKADIAIVLTDIIGSTKFVQKYGDYTSAKWFKLHDRFCISTITKFNGMLCDASDGFLIYFASVEDAIAFSIEYKAIMKRKKMPFKTRVGIHWDSMLIVKTPENLVRANHKRISLEGIGKNIAARTMSICGPNQILLSSKAYKKFKSRITSHKHIPSKTLIACAGLYKFKGVSSPETIWVIGFQESDLQPPPSGEKVKRLGGKKKIKTRLRNKKFVELIKYFFNKFAFICFLYIFFHLFPFLANKSAKKLWGVDYLLFKPFEWLNTIYIFIKGLL